MNGPLLGLLAILLSFVEPPQSAISLFGQDPAFAKAKIAEATAAQATALRRLEQERATAQAVASKLRQERDALQREVETLRAEKERLSQRIAETERRLAAVKVAAVEKPVERPATVKVYCPERAAYFDATPRPDNQVDVVVDGQHYAYLLQVSLPQASPATPAPVAVTVVPYYQATPYLVVPR